MSYFTTSKVFLFPSFGLEVQEEEKIRRYLRFLEESGVGKVISEGILNNTKNGGRPTCDYFRLFATVLYGFAHDKYTLRQLETAFRFDLRYLTLMNYERVDHTTIARFINRIILPNTDRIYMLICKQICKELGIRFDDAFIDGTKFEANANKYCRVPNYFMKVFANCFMKKSADYTTYIQKGSTCAEPFSLIHYLERCLLYYLRRYPLRTVRCGYHQRIRHQVVDQSRIAVGDVAYGLDCPSSNMSLLPPAFSSLPEMYSFTSSLSIPSNV